MPRSISRHFIAAVSILLVGCAQEPEPAQTTDPVVADNSELRRLYEQDQSDRSGESGLDWSEVGPRDSLRRERVLELLDSNLVRTSADYYHAAMVFQHGLDTGAALRAHRLAKKSVELDSTNSTAKWMIAASWDRYLMRLGKPQWYGTQYVRDQGGGAWRLYDVDTTQVTDSQRQLLHCPTLEEARANVEQWNE